MTPKKQKMHKPEQIDAESQDAQNGTSSLPACE